MSGEMPFLEYGAEDILKKALERNLISITSEAEKIKNAKYIVVCIGTPVDEYLNPKVNQFLDAIFMVKIMGTRAETLQTTRPLLRRKGMKGPSNCTNIIYQKRAIRNTT